MKISLGVQWNERSGDKMHSLQERLNSGIYGLSLYTENQERKLCGQGGDNLRARIQENRKQHGASCKQHLGGGDRVRSECIWGSKGLRAGGDRRILKIQRGGREMGN